VKIADAARPPLKPVFPNILLNVCSPSCFRRSCRGAAITSDILDKTVRDPEQVARTLHTE